MCGRFNLTATGEEIAEQLGLADVPTLAPRYNIAPTQPVASVRLNPGSGRKELTHFHWGLIPSWAKDPSLAARMINARAETVAEKPAFRAAFKYRRCLIPVTGFYEWQKVDGKKQPYHIHPADGKAMVLAGLWEHWQGPDGSEIDSCTILTTTANELMAPLHERMPVILQPDDYDSWLATDAKGIDRLQHLLRPAPAGFLAAYPIAPIVNSPFNDTPQCLQRLA